MAAERETVQEGIGPVQERLHEPVVDEQRSKWGVATGQALGARDHVGLVAVTVRSEPGAQPAKGADDLVRDQQDAVPVADLPHPLEVAGWRREAAPRVLDRLQKHGRHRVGPLHHDVPLNVVRRPPAERHRVVAVLHGPVEVGVGDPNRPRNQRLERLLDDRQPGDGQGAHGRPVVGDGAGEHLVAAGLAGGPEILAGQLPGRLHRLAAGRGEKDPVEGARRQGGQPLGQLDGARMGVTPQREVGQLLGLGGRRLASSLRP